MAGAPFHLGYFLTDAHAQAWAKPWSGNVGTEWSAPDLYVAVARELERAAMDYVLIEDNVFVGAKGPRNLTREQLAD